MHHGLDPSYEYASARFHTFMMQGARELATRAVALGITYRFALRRRNPSDDGGSSRLSPYLHNGMISPAEVVRTVRAAAPPEQSQAFLNEERESAVTHDPIWNAGQRELRETGLMHNVVRCPSRGRTPSTTWRTTSPGGTARRTRRRDGSPACDRATVSRTGHSLASLAPAG
jgi:hypothetical protein